MVSYRSSACTCATGYPRSCPVEHHREDAQEHLGQLGTHLEPRNFSSQEDLHNEPIFATSSRSTGYTSTRLPSNERYRYSGSADSDLADRSAYIRHSAGPRTSERSFGYSHDSRDRPSAHSYERAFSPPSSTYSRIPSRYNDAEPRLQQRTSPQRSSTPGTDDIAAAPRRGRYEESIGNYSLSSGDRRRMRDDGSHSSRYSSSNSRSNGTRSIFSEEDTPQRSARHSDEDVPQHRERRSTDDVPLDSPAYPREGRSMTRGRQSSDYDTMVREARGPPSAIWQMENPGASPAHSFTPRIPRPPIPPIGQAGPSNPPHYYFGSLPYRRPRSQPRSPGRG